MFATGEVATGVKWLRELSKLELKEEIVEEDDQKKIICRYTPLGLVVGIGE
jgi:hypothetical protein